MAFLLLQALSFGNCFLKQQTFILNKNINFFINIKFNLRAALYKLITMKHVPNNFLLFLLFRGNSASAPLEFSMM